VSKIDDPLNPAQRRFIENKEITIFFYQFKYIVENFSNKTINIYLPCNGIKETLPTMLKTIEIVRPIKNDRAIKSKFTKLSNILFQLTSLE